MIFGLGDIPYDNDTSQQDSNADPLDQQIEGLKAEIKAIEKEIQTKEAAQLLQEDVSKEKKQKELHDLERQVANLTKAVEHEEARITHYQQEIIKRETKQAPPPVADTSDETVQSITQQNQQLQAELKALQNDLIAEVGEDYDVDEIIKTGGSAKKRAEELQSLQAIVSKATSTYVDAKRQEEISEAGKKVIRSVDMLMSQKQELQKEVAELRSRIKKYQSKVNSLEEQNRALKTLEVLLNEKLEHDSDLIKHLQELDDETVHELPEMEVEPVSYEYIQQLLAQQQIVKGLCWKLAQCQMEVAKFQVPESFSFLADQLGQINKRCIQLENAFLDREAEATDKIQKYLESLDNL